MTPPACSPSPTTAAGTLLLCAGLLAASEGAAQVPAALDPAVIAGIDSVFLDLDRTSSPGCAVGVIRDGALAFADGYGSANLDHQIPVTPTTVFYMGSVSKQFTAASVRLAAWQGQLSLDDDVRTWIPELPDYGSRITIRHLVHHTSGIRDYLTLQDLAGDYDGTTDERIIALLARQRALNFEPGDRYLYSNSGYFLLSEILERATGQTLRQFAQRHFFGPLGMRSSHFHDDANHIVPWRATGYAPAGDGGDEWRMEHAWRFAQVGSGGLYSNVEDLARWDAAFEAGAIGPPGFRDALLERGVLNSGDTLSYAFGLERSLFRGLPVIAHGGSLAGFRSFSARFPTERTSVLVLCNATNADPGGRAEAVAALVLADRLGPEPERRSAPESDEAGDAPSYSPAQLDAFLGAFYSPELDAEFAVMRDGDGLALVRADGERAQLRPVRTDVFDGGFLEVEFRRENGSVVGFTLDAGRASGLVFERVRPGEP